MLFVSHDRTFLRGLGNRVLELGGESGTDPEPHLYPGTYVEYVAKTGHEAPGRPRVTAATPAAQGVDGGSWAARWTASTRISTCISST